MIEDEVSPSALKMSPAAGPIPRYEQVKQLIVRQIATGAWRAHQRLPSENTLVQDLGLSRMTISRALRELTTAGVLVRMQGVGTFVAEPAHRSSLLEVHNIADDVAERGHSHRLRVVRLEPRIADAAGAESLGIAAGQQVFHSLMVHYQEDVAIQLEDRYVNPRLAPDYLDQDFSTQTPNAYLSRVSPLTEVEHVVEAVLAGPEDLGLLQIAANEPCLLIRRRTWSGDDIVSSARLLHPGTRNRLQGRLAL